MPLYLVATPIGNLEDITLRALRMLREADLIACEDTRHSRHLLHHYNISKPLISYHEHNERSRSGELVHRLMAGEKIALMTDAGMPGISDPAYQIVCAAIEHRIAVIPIPGASAVTTALVASGLPTDAFLFVGFLPAKMQARRLRLESLRSLRETLVIYEAPHRIAETLRDVREICGNRRAALARELTKLHEEFLRGRIDEILEHFQNNPPRGEMTLVMAGLGEDAVSREQADKIKLSLREQVAALMTQKQLTRNDALKLAARQRGLPRREAYQQLLREEQENDSNNPSGD
jgi:16S rRNA (cytidine1402-2'-O)-methyltransferase